MFSRLREPFGKAGLIVAIIALVAALVGGAYAASTSRNHKKAQAGLNSKQKTEVKKIAQSFQGSGPAGPQGPAGAKGDAGSNGSNGSSGSDGTSVSSKTLPVGNAHCTAGGSEFIAASGTSYACNGAEGAEGPEGSPWTHLGVLPPEQTETGGWSFNGSATDTGGVYTPISFPLPLPAAIPAADVHLVPAVGGGVCTGTVNKPTAPPGHLCVYQTELENASLGSLGGIWLVNNVAKGASTAGALIYFETISNNARGLGSYAVTAPPEGS